MKDKNCTLQNICGYFLRNKCMLNCSSYEPNITRKQYIIYEDKCLSNSKLLFNCVDAENLNQMAKWGIQKHTMFEWLAYTTEELGELSNAISEYVYRDGSKVNIFFEAIQTATLAIKIAEMIKFRE